MALMRPSMTAKPGRIFFARKLPRASVPSRTSPSNRFSPFPKALFGGSAANLAAGPIYLHARAGRRIANAALATA